MADGPYAAPKAEIADAEPALPTLLGRLRTGRLPLWKAFWLVFVPTPLVLSAVLMGAVSAWGRLHPTFNIFKLLLPFSSATLIVLLAAGLVVWRNANNTSSPAWRYLALAAVGLYILWYGRRVSILWMVIGLEWD